MGGPSKSGDASTRKNPFLGNKPENVIFKIKPIKKSLTKNFHPNLSHQNQGPFCTSSSKKELKPKHIVTLNSKLSQKAIQLLEKS